MAKNYRSLGMLHHSLRGEVIPSLFFSSTTACKTALQEEVNSRKSYPLIADIDIEIVQ